MTISPGLVSAAALAAGAPADLPALLLFRRATSLQQSVVRLYAVGDIALSGRVKTFGEKNGFSALLQDVMPLLTHGDLVFGNLETPFVNRPPPSLFAAPPPGVQCLLDCGIRLLHLANNHIYDYGKYGLQSTLDTLDSVGIVPLGAGQTLTEARALVHTDRKGIRIGWLGCGHTRRKQVRHGPRYWEYHKESLIEAAQKARSRVDVLIASIHIGLMYIDYPDPKQKELAEELAAAGADLVLMHHPHVLQGVEIIDNRCLVCYSLGNFVFDWQEGAVRVEASAARQTTSAIFLFDINAQGLVQAAVLPIQLDENCCVRWPAPQQANATLRHLQTISLALQSDYRPLFRQQRAEWHTGHIFRVIWFNLKHGNFAYLLYSLTRFRLWHGAMILRWLAMRFSLRVRHLAVDGSGMSETPPLRVLIISNGFVEQAGGHGVCRDLAARLRNAGHRVLTASAKPGRLARVADMLLTVWRYRNCYDVAQVDVFSGFAFWWALAVCWNLRFIHKPYILTLHGGNLLRFARQWPRPTRRLLQSAAAVTTPSRFLQEALRPYRTDLCLLPNALDLSIYPFRLRTTAAPRIVWLRALHHVYNPLMAVQVIAYLVTDFPDIHLYLIGYDKGDGSQVQIEQLCVRLGVAENITLVGGVPKSLVPIWLDKADVFINTTHVDNAPVSVMEALASGLCVVSTSAGGIPYLLEDQHDALLVPTNDARAMAQAVRRILTTPALAENLSRHARQKAEQFSWTNIFPQWQELLATCAANKR